MVAALATAARSCVPAARICCTSLLSLAATAYTDPSFARTSRGEPLGAAASDRARASSGIHALPPPPPRRASASVLPAAATPRSSPPAVRHAATAAPARAARALARPARSPSLSRASAGGIRAGERETPPRFPPPHDALGAPAWGGTAGCPRDEAPRAHTVGKQACAHNTHTSDVLCACVRLHSASARAAAQTHRSLIHSLRRGAHRRWRTRGRAGRRAAGWVGRAPRPRPRERPQRGVRCVLGQQRSRRVSGAAHGGAARGAPVCSSGARPTKREPPQTRLRGADKREPAPGHTHCMRLHPHTLCNRRRRRGKCSFPVRCSEDRSPRHAPRTPCTA